MKKIFIVIIIILFCGCTIEKKDVVKETQLEKEKDQYQSFVKDINDEIESSTFIPFDVTIKYDKLTDDEVRYQVILDNPKKSIKNVKAVAVHNRQTDDVFPSTGIFEEPLDLVIGKKPEGIILVGYIPYTGKMKNFDCEIKVIIRYEMENKTYTNYYVTKKDNN